MTREEKLLAAIEEARKGAAKAYEFGKGCAYVYAAVQACNKVARLAAEILRKEKD